MSAPTSSPDPLGTDAVVTHILVVAASRIPRCDLVTIPAGQLVHAARPAEFASAVLTWLDG